MSFEQFQRYTLYLLIFQLVDYLINSAIVIEVWGRQKGEGGSKSSGSSAPAKVEVS
jgi:hypothetical protein